MSASRKRKASSPPPASGKRKDSPCVPVDFSQFMKAGTLARIVVRNFMCHDMLVVQLKSGMNYLMGRNGSGKSAILTAVVVGLGGKASVTNRGNSLKEFIKKGQNFCSIEITLNNVGMDAYKPEVFGDNIVVFRAINSSGVSAYKIKSSSGELVSNKRDELEKIVTAFNIQVDNPVCVLNQDTARTFLNSSDPRDKFKMFVRATYLEYIQRSLDDALECVSKSRTILKKKTEAFRSTEKEMKALEDKWNRVQGLQTHQDRCVALQSELPWAQAAEAESAAQSASEELEAVRKTTEQLESQVEALNKQISELQAAKSSLGQKLDDYRNERDVLEVQTRRLRAQLQERKRERREMAQAAQVLEDRILQHEENAAALLAQISDIQARSEGQDQRERERVSQERARLQQQLESLAVVEGTCQGNSRSLQAQLLRAREELAQLQREKLVLSSSMKRTQQDLASVRSSARNTLAVFAQWMPELVRQVEAAFRARQFSKRPVGPLGAYIETKDATWNAAIESFVKYGWLTSFCCNNSEDGRVLDRIMGQVVPRHGSKPMIVISAFLDRVHDVSANKVCHPTHSSLLDMLRIKEAVVANCLIDNLEIERVLLVPTDREACALMERRESVPHNCRRAVTKRGYEYLHSPYRSYGPANKNLQARFLQVSMDQHERNLEQEAEELRGKLARADQQLSEAARKLRSLQSLLEDNSKQLRSVTRQLHDSRAAIDQLSFEEPQAVSVDHLSREREACVAEVEKLRRQRETVLEAQEPIKMLVDQLKVQLEKTERGVGDRLSPVSIKAEMERLEEQLRGLQADAGHRTREVREARRRFESLQGQLQALQEAAGRALQQARDSGPRIEVTRSAESLQQELNSCRRYIDGVAQELGDFEDIQRSYLAYKNKFGEIRSTLSTLASKLKDTEDRLKLREKVHERAKRSFSTSMNYCFMSLLNSADFKGKVRINYQEKTLALEVQPPSNKASGEQCCTESLSGGERSYSTVSFIMALWQIVRPPFYFLDEFDVFMDKVNRNTVLKLLQTYADKNKSSQYILLTPLDLASVNTANTHVYKFDDPRP
ncbi:structural maintenance of chromosomes protein 6 [Bacillus rossius redtenbacheri]|uniref:structural maintenance of chromosomes protein 6 n=1 Tax=Bacillus rossius redtenbacheri TaxID=93214 RepID=UPI002FDE04E1